MCHIYRMRRYIRSHLMKEVSVLGQLTKGTAMSILI